MCGIVGAYLRAGPCLRALVQGLRTLEYRGYDSVGVGVVQDGQLVVRRKAGRIEELERLLAGGELDGVSIGIGHSRWATHGPPTDENAHPHVDERRRLALVHNGIIENYQELRAELAGRGVRFSSQTDTEILAHLIAHEWDRLGGDLAGITAGARADFISLSSDHLSFHGRQDDALLDSWIFGGGTGAIDGVWRAGRKVVREGRHEARDEIGARYRKTLQKLLADS